jgi:HlyD family type I secretion membrane fusion protein
MKLDLLPKPKPPAKREYVVPVFGGDDRAPMAPELQERLRRPMRVGAAIIGTFVLGLGLWASVAKVASGVTAPAEVRSDAMRKTLRAKDTGRVKAILVHEDQLVRAGQPLLQLNDTEARAAVDVLQNQYDTLLAQQARYSAEAIGRPTLEFPAELTARMSDPRVATLIRDQQFLFTTRAQLFQSQSSVLQQRIEQQQTQVEGQQAQVDSVNTQVRLTEEQLDGYRKLNEQGFAPKNLLLRYESTLADLAGRKGQLLADIARLKQQQGETRMQLVALREQRQTEAAEGARDSQTKLADVIPRLTTARGALEATTVRAPVDGYVFNLTQFTVGGVVGGGETLMELVPSGTPLTVTAMVKPQDIEEIHEGMKARIKLVGVNQRYADTLEATVTVVSADRITNEKTGTAGYRVDLKIPPSQLKKLRKGVELTPGMPAMALIVTGERSVMGFLVAPISLLMENAFREE